MIAGESGGDTSEKRTFCSSYGSVEEQDDDGETLGMSKLRREITAFRKVSGEFKRSLTFALFTLPAHRAQCPLGLGGGVCRSV